MIVSYCDPHQNIYYFRVRQDTVWNFWRGEIIKIRKGFADNIHNWKVGDDIFVTKCVCVINTTPLKITYEWTDERGNSDNSTVYSF